MTKTIFILCLSALFLLSGCDFIKGKWIKNEEAVQVETSEISDWSCISAANLDQLKAYLKSEYLNRLERDIRQSSYESDLVLLEKIRPNIKFEIKAVTTLTDDIQTAKTLNCESQVVAVLAKGLLKRAKNAYAAMPCECHECERCDGDESYTLEDSLTDRDLSFDFQKETLVGDFKYAITKTDQEGLSLSVKGTENNVMTALVDLTRWAVEYADYVKLNQLNNEENKQHENQYLAERELAQKALDIRKKELNMEKEQVVNRLNQSWERFSAEQKTQLQQDQSDWFEKRDIDCKVLSKKSVYDILEKERETYQVHANYWNEEMMAQNKDMQYTQCFIKRSTERVVYLNNVFN